MLAALEFVWFAQQTANSQDKTFLHLEYVPLWVQSVPAPRPKLRLFEEWWYALDLLNDQLKLSCRPAQRLSAKIVATIRCILLTRIGPSTRKTNGKRQECPKGIGIKWGFEDSCHIFCLYSWIIGSGEECALHILLTLQNVHMVPLCKMCTWCHRDQKLHFIRKLFWWKLQIAF